MGRGARQPELPKSNPVSSTDHRHETKLPAPALLCLSLRGTVVMSSSVAPAASILVAKAQLKVAALESLWLSREAPRQTAPAAPEQKLDGAVQLQALKVELQASQQTRNNQQADHRADHKRLARRQELKAKLAHAQAQPALAGVLAAAQAQQNNAAAAEWREKLEAVLRSR